MDREQKELGQAHVHTCACVMNHFGERKGSIGAHN